MRFICSAITLDKDTFVSVGVILTALIGLWNLAYNFQHNRRASYVASVTATRIKWIGEVRDHLSRFVALIYQTAMAPPNDPLERQRIFSEIAHHRMLLRLQLAPAEAPPDKEFEDAIESIFCDSDTLTSAQAQIQLEALVRKGQEFLWKEWRKAKDEAIFGDPYDTLPRRFERWLTSLER
jgi:hypothetical protein